MFAAKVFAAICLIMLEFNSLYYSSPIYNEYALQYLLQYTYSHICGSMVSVCNSKSCDVNKIIDFKCETVRKSSVDNMYLI